MEEPVPRAEDLQEFVVELKDEPGATTKVQFKKQAARNDIVVLYKVKPGEKKKQRLQMVVSKGLQSWQAMLAMKQIDRLAVAGVCEDGEGEGAGNDCRRRRCMGEAHEGAGPGGSVFHAGRC